MGFHIQYLNKLFGENRKVTLVNQQVQHAYFQKPNILMNYWQDLTSHPSQQLFMTYIFLKIEYVDELFCQTQQVTQVNHCLRDTYSQKLNISANYLGRLDKSPKSTTVYDAHIFEN